MYILKKITFLLILILFLFNNCTILPGINKSPNKKNPNKKLQSSEYSINDVKINIININNLSKDEILKYSKNQIDNYKKQIKDYSEIYNYRYEYILGPSDTVSIDLTDTDDLDGSYKIDQDGMIDLPFIGKIKINELSLNEAQNLLIQIIKSFYKNPDLQINIAEFNSNKVYIVGAVRNQITITLNQQPLSLIEAAIQANFNPSAEDKLFGTSGLLRREGKVYEIDLINTFKNRDEKENFYLKKDDVIFIDKNSNSIHVFGEVTQPGIYFPDMNYTLTELVSTVGINQLTANAKKVYIIREKYESFLEVDIFQLDIRNPVNLIAGKKFKVQKGDIIFIPPAEIVKWNRTISLLLPQTNLFKSYNPIINNGLQTYREP
ncbi:periplasmic protein involved in capsular polysaccharide export, putative [Candidatus Pelagibacter sp. HTCC7211]|uniref:polysaccharide biosynthesis/export family protein n=1 Tax=Pelagibacter sp. (strain HTCC7211) TaxID=439493 RepID=UPI000183B03D|nr:polysaccharide biosynthesis/export family protein [Candidatus Pelagibacter sp. HTCC7211]EDZ60534.1 periplasmic protein involved in capsular polysaccharide export, putative [Candidatus Pelagibacter sp. HTCC7211]